MFVQGDPVSWIQVHAFQTSQFKGEIIESEEMRPQWFSEDQVTHLVDKLVPGGTNFYFYF